MTDTVKAVARAMFRAIRQLLCRHEWRLTRSQALVGPPSYECTKCGKIRHD